MSLFGLHRSLVGFACLVAGCMEYFPQALENPVDTKCAEADRPCDRVLQLDQSDLLACYGPSDTGSSEPALPEWNPPATCDGSVCTVAIAQDVQCPVIDTCQPRDCIPTNPPAPQDVDCCREPTPADCVTLTAWNQPYDSFIDAVELDCGENRVAITEASNCESEPPVLVEWAEGQCEPEKGDGMFLADAAYWLYLDPGQSYIEITTSTDVAQTALSGGGSVASPPSFIGARVWADDEVLDGNSFTDWRFLLAGELDMNLQSGEFIVPHDTSPVPRVDGWGYEDAQAMKLVLGLPEDVTGEMDSSTMTWYLDFYRAGGSQPTVQMHLEGDFEAVP